ncbi:MAG: IS1595 family transposase [Limisphaerales bacterium]
MKTMEEKDELNLITLAQEYSDEDKARGLLESLLWPNGAICPHCQHNEVYKLTPKADSKRPARKGLYKCSACRKQFTVTVGTIFEDSHLPISKWLMAIFIICSSKKSISANQLSRMLKITYKAAWFMAHRLRFAVSPEMPLTKLLKGVVEVDETFVGGKGFRCSRSRRHTPVVALIERGGSMQTRVVSNVTQKNLGQALHECVSKDAVVNTDEHGAYRNPLKKWKAHHTVVHSKFEYIRHNKDGSTSGVNSCESFFSLLKRGVYGSWHHVSRGHLPKYANEFAFRWNTRHATDGERMETAIGMVTGKRLTYRQVN